MQHLVIETVDLPVKGKLWIAGILSSNSYECVHKILFQTEPEWKTVMMLLSIITVKTVPVKENQREAQAALIVTSLVALINFFLLRLP